MNIFRNNLITRPFSQWLLVVSAILVAPVSGEEAGPLEMIQGVTQQLIEIASSHPEFLDNPAELRRVAEEVVLPHVDFMMLSRWVLGKHWRNATTTQQQAFTSEFRELLMGSYLRSVSAYKDNTIRFLPLRDDRQDNHVVVHAIINQLNGPQVRTSFRLHRMGNEWLLYDVMVEGVSLVATHRSTFYQIIRGHGIDSLIEQLRAKNRINAGELAAGGR